MPGDERKFKRLTILAVIPACNCDRDAATSHAVLVEGTVCVGAGVDSIEGVPVGSDGEVGAAVSAAVGGRRDVGVGVPASVSVGEGREAGGAGSVVAAGETRRVPVEEGRESVEAGRGVLLGDRKGTGVDVAAAATGFGSIVTVEEDGAVSVRRVVVETAAGGVC